MDGADRRRGPPDRERQHAPPRTPDRSLACEARSVAPRRVGASAPRPARVLRGPQQMTDRRLPSRTILEGPDRAAARAQLKGVGFDDEALSRPIVGIANTWTETMPCNFHL